MRSRGNKRPYLMERNIRMLRYCVILCLLTSLPAILHGQAPQDVRYTDSMETVLHGVPTDTGKAALLNQLSDYWSEKDTARAVRYALRSLGLSHGSRFYLGAAHFYLAGAYFYDDPEKARAQYSVAIPLLERDTSSRSLSLLSRAWHNYGALLQRKDSNIAYMDILLNHTIPLARAAGDTLHEAYDYYSVAQVFTNILDYDKAIPYYREAIALLRAAGKQTTGLAACYTNLAKTFIYKNTESPAKPLLDSAEGILSALPPSFDHVDHLMTLGMYYLHTRQWTPAFVTLDSALALAKRLNLPYEANSVRFQQYNAYTEAGRYPEAKKILLGIYHDTLSSANAENRLMFLYNLAETDARMSHMGQAYGWMKQYAALADSLNEKKTKSDIAALEIRYQSERKQREILTLQNENKRQQLVLQKNRLFNYLLIGGILFLLLLCILTYLLYRNKRRNAVQAAALHAEQLKQIEQAHQLQVYDAMLEGQEQERRRMARDLHDGLGGMLAGVKLRLSDMAGHPVSGQDGELHRVIGQIDHSVQELRRIARNMMPETLVRFGLETALRDLCGSLQTASLKVDFQAYQLSREMSEPEKIAIYRIVQELLANAVKHANASSILVQCSQNEQTVYITVEDDGRGFEVPVRRTKGIGLSNIQNRINYLKGRMEIHSRPGEGTVINVEVNAGDRQ